MVTIPRPTKSHVGLYEITPERPWDASLFYTGFPGACPARISRSWLSESLSESVSLSNLRLFNAIKATKKRYRYRYR